MGVIIEIAKYFGASVLVILMVAPLFLFMQSMLLPTALKANAMKGVYPTQRRVWWGIFPFFGLIVLYKIAALTGTRK